MIINGDDLAGMNLDQIGAALQKIAMEIDSRVAAVEGESWRTAIADTAASTLGAGNALRLYWRVKP